MPSRKQAQLIAIDMLAFSSADTDADRFIGNVDVLNGVCNEKIKSNSLKNTVTGSRISAQSS